MHYNKEVEAGNLASILTGTVVQVFSIAYYSANRASTSDPPGWEIYTTYVTPGKEIEEHTLLMADDKREMLNSAFQQKSMNGVRLYCTKGLRGVT